MEEQAPRLPVLSKLAPAAFTLLSVNAAETHKLHKVRMCPCLQGTSLSSCCTLMGFIDAFFFRLNRSRWTRRTRPIRWYLWPPCPRSPSTNPPSTGSLRQKMGPALRLTATLPAVPLWPTPRCESHFHLLSRDTSTQGPPLLQGPPSPSF